MPVSDVLVGPELDEALERYGKRTRSTFRKDVLVKLPLRK